MRLKKWIGYSDRTSQGPAGSVSTPRWDRYLEKFVNEIPDEEGRRYATTHLDRYRMTLDWIPSIPGGSALEIGETTFFQVLLQLEFEFGRTFGTAFGRPADKKRVQVAHRLGDESVVCTSFSLDVESDFFPMDDGALDFILCAEVIEHLDVDPMFMLAEFNRLLKHGGQLLITTPNSCSAANFWKAAKGYRPHFFMQYERSRLPYRHNFEYDVHALEMLLEAGGFDIARVETFEVFEPRNEKGLRPTHEKGLKLLRQNNLSLDNRGDDIFVLATKAGPIRDRWPTGIYV